MYTLLLLLYCYQRASVHTYLVIDIIIIIRTFTLTYILLYILYIGKVVDRRVYTGIDTIEKMYGDAGLSGTGAAVVSIVQCTVICSAPYAICVVCSAISLLMSLYILRVYFCCRRRSTQPESRYSLPGNEPVRLYRILLMLYICLYVIYMQYIHLCYIIYMYYFICSCHTYV